LITAYFPPAASQAKFLPSLSPDQLDRGGAPRRARRARPARRAWAAA